LKSRLRHHTVRLRGHGSALHLVSTACPALSAASFAAHNAEILLITRGCEPMIPLITQLTLRNFLSFGPEGVSLNMRALNVLIGPNASGKSNLLEALAILRAAAGDLQSAVREGGGIGEYRWKGAAAGGPPVLETAVNFMERWKPDVVRHRMELVPIGPGFRVRETIRADRQVVYRLDEAGAMLRARLDDEGNSQEVETGQLNSDRSVLSQRRDPVRFPELTFLADSFGSVALFQDWNFGRQSRARLPQRTDLPADFLLPDGSNLGLVLHGLSQTSVDRDELAGYLQRFYEPARSIATRIVGGTLQLFVEEEGGKLIPATRLSDGTLRFLCLLAILCHPDPPPVVAIEEPELGLHPDILPTVAELLRNASERTQLFVTTHSDALVSALSDTPESILVCEGMPSGTTMRRLDSTRLKEWLAEYSLGELWRMGEIGGNRW
jgi:predicted ATPase